MATMIEFQVKGVKFSTDAAKLSPESITKVFNKAHNRAFAERFTGKKEKSLTTEQLQVEAAKFAENPNQFWSTYGTRGEGISRPKQTPHEKYANAWFNTTFMPELKLKVEKRVKIWAKYGGSGLLVKAPKKATADIKAAVAKNLAAKAAIVKAMVDLMVKNNFAIPE